MAKRTVYGEPNPFEADLRAAKKPKPTETSSHRWKMNNLYSMNAYDRHKMLINTYHLTTRGSTAKLARDTTNDRNDFDIIRENHRFLWGESDAADSWDAQLAKKYYDKLFKEYCIADLSKYERNLFAFRWRTEKEVVSGKGQFECGNKHCSNTNQEDLSTWEVNFGYVEHGDKKNALVKLRLCPDCSAKLNFYSKKRQIKKERKATTNEEKQSREGKKKRRRHDSDSREASPTAAPDHRPPAFPSTSSPRGAEDLKPEQPSNSSSSTKTSADIWAKKAPVADAERTLDDEFDEFIDDLLM